MCATDNLAPPIVKHCRTLSFKNMRLDTFLFNDNIDND